PGRRGGSGGVVRPVVQVLVEGGADRALGVPRLEAGRGQFLTDRCVQRHAAPPTPVSTASAGLPASAGPTGTAPTETMPTETVLTETVPDAPCTRSTVCSARSSQTVGRPAHRWQPRLSARA